MVDTNTLVLMGCFAAAAVVLFWLDRRHDEEIEPERRRDKMLTNQTDISGLSTEPIEGWDSLDFHQNQ